MAIRLLPQFNHCTPGLNVGLVVSQNDLSALLALGTIRGALKALHDKGFRAPDLVGDPVVSSAAQTAVAAQ